MRYQVAQPQALLAPPAAVAAVAPTHASDHARTGQVHRQLPPRHELLQHGVSNNNSSSFEQMQNGRGTNSSDNRPPNRGGASGGGGGVGGNMDVDITYSNAANADSPNT